VGRTSVFCPALATWLARKTWQTTILPDFKAYLLIPLFYGAAPSHSAWITAHCARRGCTGFAHAGTPFRFSTLVAADICPILYGPLPLWRAAGFWLRGALPTVQSVSIGRYRFCSGGIVFA